MNLSPDHPAHKALKRLKEGNARFCADLASSETTITKEQPRLVAQQKPDIIILSCADSRVPPEMIFDQGLGDLFVVRVAGNIANAIQIGSLEFAATQFSSSLLLVLGHQACGAVKATLDQLRSQDQENDLSANLAAIVEGVRPAVETVLASKETQDDSEIVAKAVQGNVHNTIAHILNSSNILKELVEQGQLHLIGGEYALDSGIVSFFE